MTFRPKMTGLTLSVTEKVKANLDRQAAAHGVSLSVWCGQLFDMAFAAVCAREKSLEHYDQDLDAIVGATLLLREREKWDTATLAKGLGVSEPTVIRILDGWKTYRYASSPERLAETDHKQVELLEDAVAREDLLNVKLPKKRRQLLEVLVKSKARWTPIERIIHALWGDDANGGPDDAEGVIHSHVCKLRNDVLLAKGWTISSSRGDGYCLERAS